MVSNKIFLLSKNVLLEKVVTAKASFSLSVFTIMRVARGGGELEV